MRRNVRLAGRGSGRGKEVRIGGTVLSAAVLLALAVAPLSTFAAAGVPTSGWLVARLIETDDTGEARAPQVALDAGGNAVAVWHQSDGNRTNIWTNRYTFGSGWGAPVLLETDNTGQAGYAQVAVDGDGNAVVVWYQRDGARYNIWANQYTAGWGWGNATLIETDNAGDALSAQVAVDGDGDAVAVWHQWDGIRNNIWANRYTRGSGWGTAGLIETDNAGPASSPQVAVDSSGNAVAVWYQSDGTRNNIWANRYTMGSGWGTAVPIETDNAGEAYDPRVATDGNGNTVVVWHQSDGTRFNAWANLYLMGSGWGNATLIETDNAGGVSGTRVAADASGNAVAVWYQSDGTRNNIWANRYAADTGWGTASLIEADNAGHAYEPNVAVGASGNAVAVWRQSDGARFNIWANRYAVGSGWGTPTLLETDNAADARFPAVAVDSRGNAVAVWEQSDATRFNLWANRFVVVDTTPPGIQLASPANGLVTNESAVWVAGATERGAQVSVNGLVASVGADGSFGLLVALRPGGNLLTVTAWDSAGNRGNATVNVTFEDPAGALEGDLAAAQSELTTAQLELAEAQADLAAAQGRLAALETKQNSTQAELVDARAQSAAAASQVGLAMVLAVVGIALAGFSSLFALRKKGQA